MIYSVKVTNYLGESITLELARPEKSGLVIEEIEGLGPPKANINMTDITNGDGSNYNSARTDPRNIVFHIRFLENPTIEVSRNLTYKFFPIKKPVTLEFQTESKRASIVGYVESNEPDIFTDETSAEISILCPDPYFYASGPGFLNVVVFYGVEPLFEFPFSNESLENELIVFSEIVRNSMENIPYEGNVEAGIVIKIIATGEVEGLKIYNLDTRETMTIDTTRLETITGHSIIEFDEITITTIKGSKSAILLRDGVYTNILNCITKDSAWFELSNGDNLFAYTTDSGSENLQFTIEYNTIYEGI